MTPHVKLTVTERNGRKCVSTGSPWEPLVGYSRAVREGDFIFVTGTVGIEPDGRFGPTLKAQTRRALEIIVAAIEALGGKASDVVRTRIYVTDITQWREAGEVHSEYLRVDPPGDDHGPGRQADRRGRAGGDRGRRCDSSRALKVKGIVHGWRNSSGTGRLAKK